MLRIFTQRRSVSTFYELFPKCFPKGKPQWNIEQNNLRKEYRALQAKHHPDMISAASNTTENSLGSDQSSLLNKAYHTLKNPLLRSQYILKVAHRIDLSEEKVAQEIMQKNPNLLMQVLDVHEQLEEVQNIGDVHSIEKENKKRITDIESQLEECYKKEDYQSASLLTVELKYWVNLAKAIKEWEPGQHLTISH